jgi:hypothetical protein
LLALFGRHARHPFLEAALALLRRHVGHLAAAESAAGAAFRALTRAHPAAAFAEALTGTGAWSTSRRGPSSRAGNAPRRGSLRRRRGGGRRRGALIAAGRRRGGCRRGLRAGTRRPALAAGPALAGGTSLALAAAAGEALHLGRHGLVERRERVGRRPEPQRGIGHAQDVRPAGDLDRNVGRHARLQLQLRVGHVDDGGVGDDVLLRDGLEPDLGHRARELLGGVGVDAEPDALARADAAHVGLVDVGVDLHLRQVGGDDEQRRRVHAGGDGLADVDIARDHDAVDGGFDDGVLQVDFALVQRGLRLDHRGLGGLELRLGGAHGHLRGLEVLRRDELPVREALVPLQLAARVLDADPQAIDVRLGTGQVGAALLDLRLDQRRVQLSDHLALLHNRVEVGVQGLDVAGHLAADLDGSDGLEGAGGADGLDDLALRDRQRGDLHLALGPAEPVIRPDRTRHDDGQDDQDGDPLLHGYPR